MSHKASSELKPGVKGVALKRQWAKEIKGLELDPMRKVCHLVGTSHVTILLIENAPIAVTHDAADAADVK